MRVKETNKRFSPSFIAGVLMLAFVTTISGCNLFERYERKPEPKVITVPDQMVPNKLDQGEPAPFDGWLFSTPLFNEYAPHWQKGPYGSDHE
ncbi:hypothetical protein [Gimesia fumaroli]|uniref:Lipoprotein n=1 Tax=Gimesia fumaroli TaxID=2527976 RepID=A0A518ICJ7_9PLAN|nr:hypothetical protein [Gimesia fumaroli]QDV50838.1 hypothetical protein Enr17x_28830 [Gimesia fumaroli]